MMNDVARVPAVGDELPARVVQLSLAKARLFSLPRESFHTHDSLAQEIGLKRAAPQGLMSYGYLSKLATDYFGLSWFHGGELKVNFINLLDREDTLTIGGRVAGAERMAGGMKVRLEVWIDTERGPRVAAGEITGIINE
jgi:hypothetical protein